MRRAALALVFSISAACGGGKANGPGPEDAAPPQPFPVRQPIAIAPLENLSRKIDADEVLVHLLDTHLREAGVRVAGPLAGSLPKGRLATPLEVQQAAAALGASWALSGTVMEFGFRESATPGEPAEPIVSVDLRILDVKTGRIAWQHSFYETAGRLMGGRDVGLGAVSSVLAKKIAAALAPPEEVTPPPATLDSTPPKEGTP